MTITFVLLLTPCNVAMAQKDNGKEKTQAVVEIESPSALLMELNSGQILFEKDGETARRPASVTKLMTMLLAFEALESGQLALDSIVTVSEHAASMGGSQVYLEPNEQQTVEDILKCMIVSSANDAAVAMGEAIAGSEEAFVKMMNDRAKELGMEQTNFENACGLEAEGHVMSAKDIAILSRELVINHPDVLDYTTIWMDTIVHKTNKGESEFGLANTNKFLKKYEGANGLKTGYTSDAGFSMSATATRNEMTLIAVVMGSKSKDIRYADAAKLLDFGFANCSVYSDNKVLDGSNQLPVDEGTTETMTVKAKESFRYVFIGNASDKDIRKEIVIEKQNAPIDKGEVVGKVEYYQNDTLLGSVDIIAVKKVEKQKYCDTLYKIFCHFMNVF
ncbi:MAG: D-alanyl-D-alanine carboxypeptidase [Lachnospiraceae bacterium]|nr:D-alanyl-D-alanine carboxypeptidase [Lachnospiraceae bacterium]